MKNLIKSRRGIAIEMAIGSMFIMIALSIVLISISGMQTRHMKSDLNDFHDKVECYEVMDYLSKNKTINGTFDNENKIEFEVDQVAYKVYKNENNEYIVKDIKNNTVLTFTTDENGKITSWGK